MLLILELKMRQVFVVMALLFLLLQSVAVMASEDALNFDRKGLMVESLFENDERITPDRSEFEVLEFAPMSSRSGERWALVTVKNHATGARRITANHLLGLFASGQRSKPDSLNINIEGGGLLSFSVSFGYQRFPLVKIYARR